MPVVKETSASGLSSDTKKVKMMNNKLLVPLDLAKLSNKNACLINLV